MELDGIGPAAVGDGVSQFEPWVQHEIISEYSLKVVESNRIRADDDGIGVNQFKPWVQCEISAEYDLEVVELHRIGEDEVGGGINQFDRI